MRGGRGLSWSDSLCNGRRRGNGRVDGNRLSNVDSRDHRRWRSCSLDIFDCR